MAVDDSVLIRKAIEKYVADSTLVEFCAGAASVPEAREVFAAISPDVVTLDLTLPGGDGLELLTEFKSGKPDVVIVVVSSMVSGPMGEEALKTGADAVLAKPFNTETLVSTVENALRS